MGEIINAQENICPPGCGRESRITEKGSRKGQFIKSGQRSKNASPCKSEDSKG